MLCCLVAKWFLCRAPNFLFSPLCLPPLSLCLSHSSCRVFVLLFFRTNLHACLLIISLACLHDVESQAKPPLASSSHHCLWCLSKLAWPIPGHPLTFDLSSTWFLCMCYCFSFCFLLSCIEMWQVGERGQTNQCENVPMLNSFKRYFFFGSFFANVLKTCGIYLFFNLALLIFLCGFLFTSLSKVHLKVEYRDRHSSVLFGAISNMLASLRKKKTNTTHTV